MINVTLDSLAGMIQNQFGEVSKQFGEVDKRFSGLEKGQEEIILKLSKRKSFFFGERNGAVKSQAEINK